MPYVTFAIAVANVTVFGALKSFFAKVGTYQTSLFITLLACISLGAFALLIDVHRYLCFLLYIWGDLIVGLLMQQFWELCSSAYYVKQSKRAFGYINIGSTLATLFVGFFLVRFLEHMQATTAQNLL